MYRPNKYQAYQSGAVFTASPGQLVLMLYDGSLKFLAIALDGFKFDDPLEFNLTINQNVLKAQAIIRELKACLDPEKNAEFVDKMTALYEYFDRRLQDANIKKEKEPIEEVIRHLQVLRDAWLEMTQQQKIATADPVLEPAGQWSAVG
jgi:flagellar secretion chaperone FliS